MQVDYSMKDEKSAPMPPQHVIEHISSYMHTWRGIKWRIPLTGEFESGPEASH